MPVKKTDPIQYPAGNASPAPGTEFTTLKKQVEERILESNREKRDKFDVIVLGVGSMGSATCFHLAKQGATVLGLEQFDIPHEMGSHTGQSRIIRKAYFEHSDYVPLLESAYHNWNVLEKISGEQVYFKTGLLYAGQPAHPMIRGVLESSLKYDIRINRLSKQELQTSYPQFNIPASYETLFEPDAGFVMPEKTILLYTDEALKNGAVIKTKTKVIEWEKTNGGITVTTSTGKYFADKLVITAGPWTPKLIPALSKVLKVTRQVIGWVTPGTPSLYELGKMPCWCITDDARPGMYYGFPVLPPGKFYGPEGFKLGHHFHGPPADPDTVNHNSNAEDEDNIAYALNKFFRDGYKSTQVIKTCLYTNTPDENFILDHLPGYDRKVVIAAGFSGHGFKFVPVVGEIMSDLTLRGSTEQPIGFLSIKRLMK